MIDSREINTVVAGSTVDSLYWRAGFSDGLCGFYNSPTDHPAKDEYTQGRQCGAEQIAIQKNRQV